MSHIHVILTLAIQAADLLGNELIPLITGLHTTNERLPTLANLGPPALCLSLQVTKTKQNYGVSIICY